MHVHLKEKFKDDPMKVFHYLCEDSFQDGGLESLSRPVLISDQGVWNPGGLKLVSGVCLKIC